MSFGHDGYIAEVLKNNLPDEALYMLRFHSFYAWHRHGAYQDLMNEKDPPCCPGCRSSIRTTSTPKAISSRT